MRGFVSATIWCVVAALGGWLVVRLLGLERGFPLVPILAYTPYVGAAALIPAVVAAATRRWFAAGAAAAVVALFGAAVLPRAVAFPDTVAEGRELQLLTANLQYGQASPRDLVGLVRRLGVDVLSIQELTPDAVAAFDRAGLGELLPHRVIVPRTGAGGSGLYARHPMRRLPARTPPGAFAMPVALVRPPGAAAVEVTVVHPLPPAGAEAVPRWRRGLASLPPASDRRARILAGDFNATLDHAALRAVLDDGYQDAAAAAGKGLAPTWPAHGGLPPVTIDHVLVDRRCEVRDVSVHTIAGSDHRAVYADIVVPTSRDRHHQASSEEALAHRG